MCVMAGQYGQVVGGGDKMGWVGMRLAVGVGWG